MSLPIDHLSALGLSPQVIAVWKDCGITHLLPLQEKAVREHGFLHGRNLLVLAPTSSGKTFIAEIAALRALERNRRVIYLVPTKALAEEKYRTFSALYGGLGYRILAATRERCDTDRPVLEGRYDLLVAVYEKMKAYLIARPEMLHGVELVVADEVQTLGERGRGATLDLLLTMITRAPYATQLIALSAVLGDDAPRLAAWLRADLLLHRERPLELREGVFDWSRQQFVYRACNSGEEGVEPLSAGGDGPAEEEAEPEEPALFRREALFALAETLAAGHGEQVLLFVPTRYVSRNWAHLLAGRLRLPPAEAALDELRHYEDTCSRDLLLETLERGIGFHNSDLAWDLRLLVEHHFNLGAIRLLVSTSTLGQGVNLSGRNVLHVPAMVETDRWTGRHVFTALTRGRFHNQGGRGARFSREVAYGRSVLVARNPAECVRLFRDFVESGIEGLEPQIQPAALEGPVLDLAASGVAASEEAVVDFLSQTFSGRVSWAVGDAPVARQVRETIARLADRMLLTRGERLEATGMGAVAAGAGLRPETVERIACWVRDPGTGTPPAAETLLVLAATPDGREFPAGPGGAAGAEWAADLRERLGGRWEERPVLRDLLFPPGGFTRDQTADLKKALVLEAWIGGEETREIEQRFQLFSGTLANLAGHFAWLVQAASALARSFALPAALARELDELAGRLVLGCGPGGLAFRSLRVAGLSRAYIQTLLREGYATLDALEEAGEDALARLIPRRVAAELLAAVRHWKASSAPAASLPPRRAVPRPAEPEASKHPEAEVPSDPAPPAVPALVVDLRGTGAAWYGGKELVLPPLPFRLLALLARRVETGASYREIEECLWPDAQVERQQVLAHRDGIFGALARHMPPAEARLLIHTRPGRGLGLTLPADRVLVRES